VEDCALILFAIAGHDRRDPASLDELTPDFTAELNAGAAGTRIGVDYKHLFDDAIDAEVHALVTQALDGLRDQGAEIVEVECPAIALAVPIGWTILLVDASSWHRQLLERHSSSYHPATRQLLELGLLLPAATYAQAQRARTRVCRDVRELFERERLDALAAPTMSRPAAAAASTESRLVIGERYRILANVTGQPAITVPCGFSVAGMPVGLQLIGAPLAEARLCRLAHAYERAHPWYLRHPALPSANPLGEASG
jgi:aspartyl-tRNA(Asn)/glutamyl-tRNA(Gln) amidotransferase subunit A